MDLSDLNTALVEVLWSARGATRDQHSKKCIKRMIKPVEFFIIEAKIQEKLVIQVKLLINQGHRFLCRSAP